MAKGRQHENWTHTANVMATLANIHRSEDADVVMWEHLHPQYEPIEAEVPEVTTEQLIAMGFRPLKTEAANG